MKIATKKGIYYVYLPSKLYNKIVELVNENSQIDLGLLAFLLNLIIKNKFKDKELENGREWVSLCSKIIRDYDCKNYSASYHLKFLEEKGMIMSLPHIKNIKGKSDSCKKFKLSDEYLMLNGDSIYSKDSASLMMSQYEISNKKVSEKYHKRINQRKATAEYKTEQLTKWLNESGFEMAKINALKYIDETYYKVDDSAKK